MRINSISNHSYHQSHQNKTSFKSKLPSVDATYNINPLLAEVIPDYWPILTENCDPKQKDFLKELLTRLTENFDNNILALSRVKSKNGDNDLYCFRLYKNTDELLKHAGSASEFNKANNYYNSQILIDKNLESNYLARYGNTVANYGKCGKTNVLLNVLSEIVRPNSSKYKAIYNSSNYYQEIFLKDYREKAVSK